MNLMLLYEELSSDEMKSSEQLFKTQMLAMTMALINKNPKLYIGVPKSALFILNILSAKQVLV